MARRNINWLRTEHLAITKCLAWVAFSENGASERSVWATVEKYLEPVVREVTGESGVTLAVVCEETLGMQGLAITPNKVWQRADRAERYGETTGYEQQVILAYAKAREVA